MRCDLTSPRPGSPIFQRRERCVTKRTRANFVASTASTKDPTSRINISIGLFGHVASVYGKRSGRTTGLGKQIIENLSNEWRLHPTRLFLSFSLEDFRGFPPRNYTNMSFSCLESASFEQTNCIFARISSQIYSVVTAMLR